MLPLSLLPGGFLGRVPFQGTSPRLVEVESALFQGVFAVVVVAVVITVWDIVNVDAAGWLGFACVVVTTASVNGGRGSGGGGCFDFVAQQWCS